MRKLDKPSPTESPLRFEIDPEPASETLTALGGIPLLVQAFRSLGLPASVERQVRIKQRQRGYDEATMVESFVILNAAGGECLEDFDRLREDGGLAELIGHALPSPEAARNFLYQFHADEKIVEAQQQLSLAARGESRECLGEGWLWSEGRGGRSGGFSTNGLILQEILQDAGIVIEC